MSLRFNARLQTIDSDGSPQIVIDGGTVETNVGLTADVGSAQGNGVITSSYNVYSTVANAGDAATLPATFAVGNIVYVKNDGANSMDVFPASGDDAGAGTNIAVAVPNGESKTFIGTVVDTTWTELIVGGAGGGGGDVTASGSPLNNEIAVFTAATDIDSDSTFTWDGTALTATSVISPIHSANAGTHLTVENGGVVTLRGFADGDTSTRRIDFDQLDGTRMAFIGQSLSANFNIENETTSGLINLIAADSGDIARNLFVGDPNGAASIYYNGVSKLATTNTGVSITGTATATTFSGSGASLTTIPVTGLANGTDGELITWSAAGVAATVAVGTVNQVLTSGGTGVAPTFQALPATSNIVTDYVDSGSLTLATTTYQTGMSVLLLQDINYMIHIVFDVQAPSADDIKMRFSGIGASSSINAIFHESETDLSEPMWATTAETISNEIIIPCNGGTNGQGQGTYCTIQGTVNVAGGDVTLILQFAKNADTGADGFIRVYRGMTCIPIV